MKHILPITFIFSALLSFNGFAQITINGSSFPSSGDTLFITVDDSPDIELSAAGGDQIWSYTSLEATSQDIRPLRPAAQGPGQEEFPNADFYREFPGGVVGYYRNTGDQLLLLGFYGSDPLGFGLVSGSRFDPPVVERQAPLQFFDNAQQEFDISLSFAGEDLPDFVLDQLPATPDSMRVRANTNRISLVDAWGELTVAGESYEVLREKRTDYTEGRVDALIPFVGWLDVTDVVTEILPDIEGLGMDTTIAYYYYSNDIIEPVAVVEMNDEGTEVERVEYKGGVLSNVAPVFQQTPSVRAYPNPAVANVNFAFSNLPTGNYTLNIYNILGTQVRSRQCYIQGDQTETVNLSRLNKGTYLYSLVDAQGKIIVTRRLMVNRP